MQMIQNSKYAEACGILDDAIAEHEPVHIYAGYSGGDDSLCVTDVLMRYAKERGLPATVLHINTGIGIEKTRRHVRQTCEQMGWPLREIHAKDDCGQDYDELVLTHGFPGPDHHTKMYNRLKERAVYKACAEAKEGHSRMARVLFVTGIRAEESARRAGYGRVVHKVRAQVWVNPLYNWTGTDCHRWIKAHDLPRNPVSKLLGMSGECLCGAYAHKGELEMIRLIEPETAERIEELERETAERGMPWKWEHPGPPQRWLLEREGQQSLFQPLCVGCGKTHEERQAA